MENSKKSNLDVLIEDLEKSNALFDSKGNLKKGMSRYILLSVTAHVNEWIKQYSEIGINEKLPISIIYDSVKNKNPYVAKYIKYQTFRLWFLKLVEKYKQNESAR